MFNMGLGELIVVGTIALIFIGPKQLPEVARTLAKVINELKRALGDVSTSFKKGRDGADDWMKDLTSQIVNSSQPKPEESQNKPYYISPEPESKPQSTVTEAKEKDEKKS